MVERTFKQYIFRWQIFGFLFLVIGGSLLHFIYEWSGYSSMVAIFSAANESVWEHLKLGFWALVLYSIIEYWFIKGKTKMYFLAKAAGIFSMQIFIVIFFYSYTAIIHREILALDIGSYVLGSFFCQIISYKILINEKKNAIANAVGISLLLLHGFSLIIFTFIPPKLPIFMDSNTGQYGIDWNTR